MPSILDFAAAVTLALPLASAGNLAPESAPAILSAPAMASADNSVHAADPMRPADAQSADSRAEPTSPQTLKEALIVRQVRLKQRVFIRIAPRGIAARRNMLAELPVRTRRYKERKAERCVNVKRIAGVETGNGNRLLLFLEDAEIMSVSLEKACRARDFYSGFYLDQNKDGKMCAERDVLQSRNGARCDIERIMELVAIED